MYRMEQGRLQRPVQWLEDAGADRAGLVILIAAMAGAAALILWLERGTTYMSDEWAWVNFAGDASTAEMFQPFNQHLSFLVLLPTKIGLDLWGITGAMLPFKLIGVAGALACGALVYAFARPRVGPLVALAPAMIPMYLGTATVILLQPLIGLQVLYSLAFGVGALVALDRGSRAGDIAASLLLVLSLASFSTGLAFLAGVAVAVLLAPKRVRRAYVFLIPALLYGGWRLWALKYGTTGGPELANVPALPFYWIDSLALTASALFGRADILAPGPGTYLFVHGFALPQAAATLAIAAVEVAVIAFAARRLARSGPIPVTFWATLAVLLTLWTTQGLVLVDGRTPGETRYIYPGAIALALLVSEAARRIRFSRRGVAIVLVLTVLGIVGNLPRFLDGRDAIAYHAPRNLAYVGLMELAGDDADPNFFPPVDTPEASPAGALSFSVQGYRELSARHGRLGYSPERIAAMPADIRHGSDEVLIGMLRLRLDPGAGTSAGACRPATRGPAGARLRLPRGGAILRSAGDTPVTLRRFGDAPGVPIGRLEPNRPTLLRIPPDSARLPWVLETPEAVALSACRTAAG